MAQEGGPNLNDLLDPNYWANQIKAAIASAMQNEGAQPTSGTQPTNTTGGTLPNVSGFVEQTTGYYVQKLLEDLQKAFATVTPPAATGGAPTPSGARPVTVTVKAPPEIPEEIWYQLAALAYGLGETAAQAVLDIAQNPDAYDTYRAIADVLYRLVPQYINLVKTLKDLKAGAPIGIASAEEVGA
jgi:hypothetical protein